MTRWPSPDDCRRIFAEEGLDERVVAHVEAVARLAERIAAALHEKDHRVDVDLVRAGALLHDIGRSKTHTIRHASVGADLLRRRGLPEPLVLCVERHTGGGIDEDEARSLGLPLKDYTPRSLEEKIVCHADNLFDGARRQRFPEEAAYLASQGLPHVAEKERRLHAELSRLLEMDLDDFR